MNWWFNTKQGASCKGLSVSCPISFWNSWSTAKPSAWSNQNKNRSLQKLCVCVVSGWWHKMIVTSWLLVFSDLLSYHCCWVARLCFSQCVGSALSLNVKSTGKFAPMCSESHLFCQLLKRMFSCPVVYMESLFLEACVIFFFCKHELLEGVLLLNSRQAETSSAS